MAGACRLLFILVYYQWVCGHALVYESGVAWCRWCRWPRATAPQGLGSGACRRCLRLRSCARCWRLNAGPRWRLSPQSRGPLCRHPRCTMLRLADFLRELRTWHRVASMHCMCCFCWGNPTNIHCSDGCMAIFFGRAEYPSNPAILNLDSACLATRRESWQRAELD